MFARSSILLLTAFSLAACDRISGVADQKIADAEAIGYACRVSLKKPEDCMKENETQSPSSVLDGWKSADKDIKDKKINADMSNSSAASEVVASSAPSAAETEATASGDKTAGKIGSIPAEEPKKSVGTDAHKPASH